MALITWGAEYSVGISSSTSAPEVVVWVNV
jgi:hypothetical protein